LELKGIGARAYDLPLWSKGDGYCGIFVQIKMTIKLSNSLIAVTHYAKYL
jgi:hypothetical protein